MNNYNNARNKVNLNMKIKSVISNNNKTPFINKSAIGLIDKTDSAKNRAKDDVKVSTGSNFNFLQNNNEYNRGSINNINNINNISNLPLNSVGIFNQSMRRGTSTTNSHSQFPNLNEYKVSSHNGVNSGANNLNISSANSNKINLRKDVIKIYEKNYKKSKNENMMSGSFSKSIIIIFNIIKVR
jgi:hypothetical protein